MRLAQKSKRKINDLSYLKVKLLEIAKTETTGHIEKHCTILK